MNTFHYGGGTSITRSDLPFATNISAIALCADGKLRRTTRLGVPDTYWTTPAAVRVRGRIISGFIELSTASGSSITTDEDPAIVYFHANRRGANAHLLNHNHRPTHAALKRDLQPEGTTSMTHISPSSWLASLPHTSAITPLQLTIAKTTYDACIYTARFTALDGAVARGDYDHIFIYALGNLPACYRRSTRVAFRIDADPTDWYIASYWPTMHNRQQPAIRLNSWHPFGPNFLLSAWTAPAAIDKYERKPYRRVKIKTTTPQTSAAA